MWSDVAVENPDKYIKLVERIGRLTESQAKAYYESMEASRAAKVHGHLSKRVLSYLSGKIMHPDDFEGQEELKNDLHISSELSSGISTLLSYVYPFGVPLVILIYSSTSWWYYGQKKISTAPNPPQATIQNNDGRQEPNGQNYIND